MKSKRDKLLGLIHMAKKRSRVCGKCGRIYFEKDVCPECDKKLGYMPEFWYRSILESVSGKDSCGLLNEGELKKVLDVFNEAGFRKAYPYLSPTAEQAKQNAAVRANIERRGKVVLGDNWESRIQGFIKKTMNKDSLKFLNAKELRKVIGWINRLDAYKEDK